MLTWVLQVMADYLRLFMKYALLRLEKMYGAVDASLENIQWYAALRCWVGGWGYNLACCPGA